AIIKDVSGGMPMIDIELSRVEESGEQIVVRRNTFEDEKEAEEIYNLLTDDYADQSLPFFDKWERLIRLDILPQSAEEVKKQQNDSDLEYHEHLLDKLQNRI